jgi:hypothetical protein
VVAEERVAEGGAAADAVDEVHHDGLQTWRGRQLFENRERPVEREARLEQRRELLREREELAGADAAARREPERAAEADLPALGVRLHTDRIERLLVEALHDGPRVGRFHDAVDRLAATVGGPVSEDRHPVRRLPA